MIGEAANDSGHWNFDCLLLLIFFLFLKILPNLSPNVLVLSVCLPKIELPLSNLAFLNVILKTHSAKFMIILWEINSHLCRLTVDVRNSLMNKELNLNSWHMCSATSILDV